jgi:hypothetical protein
VDPPQPSSSALSGPIFSRNAARAKVNNKLWIRGASVAPERTEAAQGAATKFAGLWCVSRVILPMKHLSLILWSVGLVLQVLLLALLFRRGLARRFPVLTGLIAFYVVRSLLLYGLIHFAARDTYQAWYDALSLADIALQMALAAEIATAALRERSTWSGRRVAFVIPIAVAVVAAAGAAAAFLPARGPVPVDRGSAFASLLLALVFVWVAALRAHGPALLISAGFAVYGIVAVAAAVERHLAALHRNPGAYVAGSYTSSGVYLAVLLFWILALKPDAPAPARLATAQA